MNITLISALVAALVSFIVTKITIKSADESKLKDEIFQMNRIAIEYPYLEDDNFCKAYSGKNDGNTLRYDSYCCIVFNLVEKIWKHFKGNKKKINEFFCVKEMIMMHSKWWLSDKNRNDNLEGYNRKFISFVDAVLEGNNDN